MLPASPIQFPALASLLGCETGETPSKVTLNSPSSAFPIAFSEILLGVGAFLLCHRDLLNRRLETDFVRLRSFAVNRRRDSKRPLEVQSAAKYAGFKNNS